MGALQEPRNEQSERPSVSSLDDVRAILGRLPGPHGAAAAAAAAREAELTKPAGALGRLEELSQWLAAWQGRYPPRLERVATCVFAGNHGVAAQGVSAYPPEVTAQMVGNFRAGGAAINQLCRAVGAELNVYEMDLEKPTADITKAPAMDEEEVVEAFRRGTGAVESGLDLLCLGEMGIANTTVAAAVAHALFGGEAGQWTGPGTGLDAPAVERKAAVVAAAVRRHREGLSDALEVMRRLGGRELAAIAGAVLAARLARVPVVLDGYASTAAASVLFGAEASALDHCQVAHVSAEPGHRRLIERIGKRALMDLGMRLGEATGATLAVPVLKAAVACHGGMATFAEAGVTGRSGAGNEA
jgi:nicotinate-nucleotide--dimethylbenzimidazole phosphoribosyltransferase